MSARRDGDAARARGAHERLPGVHERRRPRSAATFAAVVSLSLLAGCATYTDYEGARPAEGVATIQADPRINAGLPMTVTIRRLDSREIGPQYSSVAVAAGTHRLLVDCTMGPTHATTRHELNVEVEAGGRYRLVAESAPGNRTCGEVRLEPR